MKNNVCKIDYKKWNATEFTAVAFKPGYASLEYESRKDDQGRTVVYTLTFYLRGDSAKVQTPGYFRAETSEGIFVLGGAERPVSAKTVDTETRKITVEYTSPVL